MDILDNKSNQDLLDSLIAEIAKAGNEIRCARRDIEKASSRMAFVTVVANKLIERQGD